MSVKRRIIDDEFIERLETLTLCTNSVMQGFFGGSHKTNAYGSTIEFADFREYVPGDDIRRIDWNLYSRFEKHFIKLFVDERQMHNQVFLDCSASMDKVDPKKGAYVLRLMAALGFLSVHNMDKVSFKLMCGDACVDSCGVIAGKDAYYHSLEALERTVFKGDTHIDKSVQACPNPGYDDGLTVIISDFLTENDWKKAVDYLLFRHRQVMLIQVLSPDEADPAYNGRIFLRDAESDDVTDPKNMKMRITKSAFEAYRTALSDYIAEIRHFCRSRGVTFLSVTSDTPIERLLFGGLYETGVVQ